jgi:uncharacterized membrane protein
MRILVWLAIVALALLGRWLNDEAITAAIVPVALAFLLIVSPAALRGAIIVIAVTEAMAWGFGDRGLMIDILPVAIAGFVGWLFARSLAASRRPLIACAIAAIDGEAYLHDSEVARYARRLTGLWAAFQAALAFACLLCVLRDRGLVAAPALPSPRLFGAIVLPLAVAALFLGEFALRPRLLPQAPRHSLPGFLRALARVWPELVEK